MNTVVDVNRRYGVTEQDRVLGVSALDFDLSVYDIFGLLTAGGSVVLVGEHERRVAYEWQRLVERWRVSVWNSVPALLEMLLAVKEGELGSLRLALLSGDWIGLDLPERLRERVPSCSFVALGGAQAGPFGMDALRGHVSGGQLTRETLVWRQGMAAWTPAGDVADLQPLFAAAPPPLPPS